MYHIFRTELGRGGAAERGGGSGGWDGRLGSMQVVQFNVSCAEVRHVWESVSITN